MEIFYKEKQDGTFYGEFHETKPSGFITQEELPIIESVELVPTEVTAIQLLTQLELEGITQDAILQVIETLESPNNIFARVSFLRATLFDRDNELMQLVGLAFEKTELQLDQIFINANNLNF
jgi:ribosome assembly protein YihI (activator of Der GTPase)